MLLTLKILLGLQPISLLNAIAHRTTASACPSVTHTGSTADVLMQCTVWQLMQLLVRDKGQASDTRLPGLIIPALWKLAAVAVRRQKTACWPHPRAVGPSGQPASMSAAAHTVSACHSVSRVATKLPQAQQAVEARSHSALA